MSERSGVFLLDRKTGKYVDSVLIDGVGREEIEAAEKLWQPAMAAAIAAKKAAGKHWPEHHHWDWRKKYAAAGGGDVLLYQFLGVECAGEMQGLMMLQTAGVFCRCPGQNGKGLVYVPFIATAPWNSPDVVDEVRYGQVGSVLISAAIQASKDLGFAGRLGLHSLPQAEGWYGNHCNMTDLGLDFEKENLRYFEMTAEQAASFLS